MLAEDDVQQILGDWVLVWLVSDHQQGQDLLKNLSSSHVEMRLQEDNQTLMFSERNRFSNNNCINYYINISMELLHNPNQTMHPIEGKIEVDGVLSPYNETAIVNYYEACPNCMMMVFKTKSMGNYLVNYRKEGHHQDVDHMKADHDTHRKIAECLGFDHDQPYIYDGVAGKEGHHQDVDHMKADHDTHRKMAECLGFDHDQPYIYDGVADFCHKKSSLEMAVDLPPPM
ncbi:saxitoxin and tetrodotoxin-binding protein 2-like isoform X5 [Trematomus bernacchii]|uniref:saxitoxin and tetrodotoxin-binding protein 2-like isoform X5 n=1 Tax=Trematomus bernacchii TaxID=40690 RepID=UPI00146B80B0|nr:saxitoxin and tetrodotoxin-binding protein 2-like isoform X5 [Trematomus bernacchii]